MSSEFLVDDFEDQTNESFDWDIEDYLHGTRGEIIDNFSYDGNVVRQSKRLSKTLWKYSVLPEDEQKRLIKQYYKTWDREIRNKIVNSNLKFVIMYSERYFAAIKDKYNLSTLEFDDLVSAWYIWLLTAIEARNYDPNKWKFLWYAKHYIRANIANYLKRVHPFFWKDDTSLNRFNKEDPFNKKKISWLPGGSEKKVDEYIDYFFKENWRLPIDDEIQDFCIENGMAPDYYKYYKFLKEWVLSLDDIIDNNNLKDYVIEDENAFPSYLTVDIKDDLFEVLVDKKINNPLESEDLKTDIGRVLLMLRPRRRQIVEWFYWLNDCHEMEVVELAEVHWLSRERIRQIEKKWINDLKVSKSARKLLKKYL